MAREKFTTTLEETVIQRLGILKVLDKKRGLNDIIEELVNNKWEEINNDTNKEERQGNR